MENNHKSCNICLRKVQSHSVFIECANCYHVYHVKCINADRNNVIPGALWYCMHCLQTIFPFNHIEDNQEFFQWSWNVSRIILFNFMKWTPFPLKPFTEMDPDIQFYSSTHSALNTQCEYFIGDTFLTNITEKNKFQNKLSSFHINVKSLPKHHDQLE